CPWVHRGRRNRDCPLPYETRRPREWSPLAPGAASLRSLADGALPRTQHACCIGGVTGLAEHLTVHDNDSVRAKNEDRAIMPFLSHALPHCMRLLAGQAHGEVGRILARKHGFRNIGGVNNEADGS